MMKYDVLRTEFEGRCETFHKITIKLFQSDILGFRAQRQSGFEKSRVRVAMEL